jgi:hypothetical protein
LSTPRLAARVLSEAVDARTAPNLAVAVPHRVYFVGFDDVVAGRVFSAAQPTGWRYLLLDGDTARAAVEIIVNDDGAVEGFSHVDEGPFVESMVAGMTFAEEFEASRRADYELRLLSVPSLYLVALWLHGDDDVLVPLAPTPGGLDTQHAYTEEEILSSLSDLIERRKGIADPMP